MKRNEPSINISLLSSSSDSFASRSSTCARWCAPVDGMRGARAHYFDLPRRLHLVLSTIWPSLVRECERMLATVMPTLPQCSLASTTQRPLAHSYTHLLKIASHYLHRLSALYFQVIHPHRTPERGWPTLGGRCPVALPQIVIHWCRVTVPCSSLRHTQR